MPEPIIEPTTIARLIHLPSILDSGSGCVSMAITWSGIGRASHPLAGLAIAHARGLIAPPIKQGSLMRAFIFPGQGSQAVGMGAALAEASRTAHDVFDEVDEALGQNLFRLMRDGPDDELKLTENAQPAIMAHSLAVFRALTRDGGVDLDKAASFVAGHSLGEYSALCAAGSFDLATTAKLLKLRGQAMQQAVPVGRGRDGGAARRRPRAGAEDRRRRGARRSLHRRQRQ